MTASRLLPVALPSAVHEHAWVTESVHATSEGRVRYVRCTGCIARRVDLDPAAAAPAAPLSREFGAAQPSSPAG
jgi:hypothetical protein